VETTLSSSATHVKKKLFQINKHNTKYFYLVISLRS